MWFYVILLIPALVTTYLYYNSYRINTAGKIILLYFISGVLHLYLFRTLTSFALDWIIQEAIREDIEILGAAFIVCTPVFWVCYLLWLFSPSYSIPLMRRLFKYDILT